jgi:hypothetical protein
MTTNPIASIEQHLHAQIKKIRAVPKSPNNPTQQPFWILKDGKP